jgi:hypothetical protein
MNFVSNSRAGFTKLATALAIIALGDRSTKHLSNWHAVICLLVLSTSWTRTTKSETVDWIRQLGTSSDDISYSVSADGIGNVYITGHTFGNLGGANVSGADAFLSRYDASGNLKWTSQLGGNADYWSNGVSADAVGGVYITGQMEGSLGGANPGGDIFLSRYDTTGNLQWTKELKLSTTFKSWSNGVSTDGLGGVYIAGYTEGHSLDADDVFVSRYDSAGNLQWTRQLNTKPVEQIYGVSADELGSVYVSGVTYGDLDGKYTGNGNAFLSRYDAAGNLHWTRQFGTSLLEVSRSVSADGLGGVYITGYNSSANCVGGPCSGADAFINRYDSAGNLQWTRLLGASSIDSGNGVSADGLGGVYISGFTYNNLGGENAGGADAFISRYDASGNLQWTRQLGTGSDDRGNGVSADGLGNVYITGTTRGSLGSPNTGLADSFVARITDSAFVPPRPPRPDPITPPPSASQYSFVVGVQPHFEWTPITLELNLDVAVPGLETIHYGPSVTYPESPIAPDIGAQEFSFSTNNQFLGTILNSLAPQQFDLLTANGTAGLSLESTAQLGVFLRDEATAAEIGAKIGAGLYFTLSLGVDSDLFNVFPPPLHNLIKGDYKFKYPIAGTAIPDLPSIDVPLGQEIELSSIRSALANQLQIPIDAIKGTITSPNGIVYTFADTTGDDNPDEVSFGISLAARASLETIATAGLDVYFRAATDSGVARQPLTERLPSVFHGSVDYSQVSSITSDTGSIFPDGTHLSLTTGSPVWIVSEINVNEPTNLLAFDAAFTSDSGAEGLFSVYWNNQLVAMIDERTATPELETYIFYLSSIYQPGSYSLALRLDSYTDVASSIEIDHVVTGFAAVPEPSSLWLFTIAGVILLVAQMSCRHKRINSAVFAVDHGPMAMYLTWRSLWEPRNE